MRAFAIEVKMDVSFLNEKSSSKMLGSLSLLIKLGAHRVSIISFLAIATQLHQIK